MLFRFVEEGFDRVLFDCDSTLSEVEGIDELARRKRCLDRVEALTQAAMNGRMDFAQSLDQRLSIIQPSSADIDSLGDLYVKKVTPGGRELIGHLKAAGIEVHIVSGGFGRAIQPLAEYLGVSNDHVAANELLFDERGRYVDFERDRPTAHSKGKRIIADGLSGVKAMVGDGASDLETAGAVDLVIGYCGIQRRQTVEEQADVVVYSHNLMAILPLLLGAYRLTRENHPRDAHVRLNSESLRKAYLGAGLRFSA